MMVAGALAATGLSATAFDQCFHLVWGDVAVDDDAIRTQSPLETIQCDQLGNSMDGYVNRHLHGDTGTETREKREGQLQDHSSDGTMGPP